MKLREYEQPIAVPGTRNFRAGLDFPGLAPSLTVHTYIIQLTPLGDFQWPITSST